MQVIPTFLPALATMWAIRRVVVVFPLTPVTLIIGIRPLFSAGNIISMIASPTGFGVPEEGSMCILRPGPALTSTITPR